MNKKIALKMLILMVLVIAAGAAAACARTDGGFVSPNEASELIPDLTTEIKEENRADFDFTENAMDYLEFIGTKLPVRDITDKGSDHEAAREWIISELKKAGYSDDQIEQQKFVGEGSKVTNIILTVEGEDTSHQIIAGAHYDGDGVGDNGSGTALLLANAVGLAGVKPHYTVKYIFFGAEEIGCVGSSYYSKHMSDEEAAGTIYMINLDSLAFGDYCNIYGGDQSLSEKGVPGLTDGYDIAADITEQLGFEVMRTSDLDGYFAEHGTGPEIEEGTLYTNPWTDENPSASNYSVPSPATLPASDHIGFMYRGIEYIYFEATNWFAEGENDDVEATSYTGYIETYDYSLGEHGMFMNTEYDTWENLNKYFPGRAEKHFRIYSPLLSAMILVK